MENLNLSQRNIFFLYVIEWERSFPTDTLHQKGGHIGSILSHLKFIAKIDTEIKLKKKNKTMYAARACVCSIWNHKRFKSKSIQVDFKSTEMAMCLCFLDQKCKMCELCAQSIINISMLNKRTKNQKRARRMLQQTINRQNPFG